MSRPSTSLILGSGLAYHLRLARRGGEEKTQHFRGGPNLRTDSRLTDFLDLPWHENLLSHEAHARRGPISSPSYADVSEPIYQHARYRWTNYANPLRDALPALRPYEERFGYALD